MFQSKEPNYVDLAGYYLRILPTILVMAVTCPKRGLLLVSFFDKYPMIRISKI